VMSLRTTGFWMRAVWLGLVGTATPACMPQERGDHLLPLSTQQDTVRVAIARLHGLVRTIDEVGRRVGVLPQALVDPHSPPGCSGRDPWGRQVRYSVTGRAFEIRSAGPDGMMDTADDIVAIGRLGRSIPCEMRHGGLTTTWVRVAPPCERMNAGRIYALCPGLSASDRMDRSVPGTPRDSMLAVGQRLVRVARAIDGYGREIGATPESLSGPLIWGRTGDGEILDLWGSVVRYRTSGEEFELTSAGPDRNLNTADDIIVTAAIGSGVPCEFETGWGRQRCAEPIPGC
jgi:hypothetical protein